MSSRPEQLPDPQKEAILAKSPFTRSFLDTGATKSDPKYWAQRIETLSDGLQNEVRLKFGDRWSETLVGPLLISSNAQGIFNPAGGMAVRYGIVMSLFEMGYELGDENWKLLADDIASHYAK